MFTKKQKGYGVLACILVIICMFVFCSKCKAADNPVNTWPRNYLTFGVLYTDNVGAQVGYAYQFRSGLIINPTINYTQCNGQDGTSPFKIGHRSYAVPYSTGSDSHVGVGFSVSIPLDRHEKK